MRVKISYGAEIEEVPEEVEQLFTYVSEKSRTILRQAQKIEEVLEEEDVESSMFLIEKMRKTLVQMDKRLSDIQMISAGYIQHSQGDTNVSDRRLDMGSTGVNDSFPDS